MNISSPDDLIHPPMSSVTVTRPLFTPDEADVIYLKILQHFTDDYLSH